MWVGHQPIQTGWSIDALSELRERPFPLSGSLVAMTLTLPGDNLCAVGMTRRSKKSCRAWNLV